MSRWIVAGLGNPGARYVFSRHNAGLLVLERLARRWGLRLDREGYRSLYGLGRGAGAEVLLLAPQTYMNRSGEAVRDLYDRRSDAGPLLVLSDDLDLPLGRVRLKADGGSGGHRGVESVILELGRTDFFRLRVGIGRPAPGLPVESWVLSAFTDGEAPLLDRVLETAADAVETLLRDGIGPAMNAFNGRDLRGPGGPEGDGEAA